ncbi:mitochondrial ubiquitin ligase activator of NFKB 1 [Arapaima gigas]
MDPGGRPSLTQLALLATSSALTAACYCVYRMTSHTAARLQEAKILSLDQDLKNILSESPGKCVPYAVIEGVVRAVKETLNSQFVDNCKGVIQRLNLREHKMVWNRTTHLWNDCEKVIHQRTSVVPFDLVSHDDSVTASVRVIRPLDAAQLELEVTYENFHPVTQSFTDAIGHFISGERPKGIKETEEMLKLGDCMTGVGELILEHNLIRLQPPKQGLQYFLSHLDYKSLLTKQQASARFWKVLTAVFGIATCIVLYFVLRKQYAHYKEKRKRKSIEEEFREFQRKRQHELNMTEEAMPQNTCIICLSCERSTVFLECGHVCSCDKCYHLLPAPKKCPICRRSIDRVIPLYNS